MDWHQKMHTLSDLERDIIKLSYGFKDLSSSLIKQLEDAGHQPGDLVPDTIIAMLVGLGPVGLRKTRDAALNKLRQEVH